MTPHSSCRRSPPRQLGPTADRPADPVAVVGSPPFPLESIAPNSLLRDERVPHCRTSVEVMASRFGSRGLAERMRASRIAAEAQMSAFDAEGEAWDETAITALLLSTTYPLARYVKFNQVEEGTTGADWIWWWIDEVTGEAFGAVVQAKRLKKESSRWYIDFRYRGDHQRQSLEFLGQYFEVVPLYVLYLGTTDYRNGAFCRAEKHADECELCASSTLSVVPALLTRFGGSKYDETGIALSFHVSLEELVDPAVDPDVYWGQDFAHATDEFVRFLHEPQAGARQIARSIVDQLRRAREGMFSAATDAPSAVQSDSVFSSVPYDHGHFAEPYFQNALRGLRSAPPEYVQRFLATGELPEIPDGQVAGLAVFTIPAPSHQEGAGAGDADAGDDDLTDESRR